MPHRYKCAKCDKTAALQWTLFNGQTAAIAPLCLEHGSYLSELVNIVGPKPTPTESIPTVKRLPKVRPLQWSPPGE
jgi:hypothetical protein